MPKAIDLIIKDGASQDQTFALVSPAAGDGSMAAWALKKGEISSVFPQLTAQADRRPSSRGLKVKLFVPSSYTDSVTGRTMVGSRAEINISVAVPNDFPEARKDDFAAFATGAVGHALIKALIRDAVSAT